MFGSNRVDSEQSSSSSEEIKTESSALEATSSNTDHRKSPAKTEDRPSQKQRVTPEQKTAPSFSKKADDDEKSHIRAQLPDPEAEFRKRMHERHPNLDAEDLLKTVKTELNNGNAELPDFLELDTKKTTNPRRLANPGGHYRELARLVSRQSLEIPPSGSSRRSGQGSPAYKCPKCYSIQPGEGMLYDKGAGAFVFCECANETYRVKAAVQLKQFNEPRPRSEAMAAGKAVEAA